MYKIDKKIKTKLTEKEIKKKLYNISSKKDVLLSFSYQIKKSFLLKKWKIL